jgi:GNAT superfamily N-acetyltransferase
MIEVAGVELEAIVAMRDEYRREMDCQIVHDSWHGRGFTRSYRLRVDGETVGYGSVGGAPSEPTDIVKEFFVRAHARRAALPLFRQLAKTSGARRVEAQTNDLLLSLMLYDCAVDVSSDRILFADAALTVYAPPDVELRPIADAERGRVFAHTVEPVGDWGLERGGEVVATGGIRRHYNPPYGDIYMEVAASHRRQGLGSYLAQELKRICYESGFVPGARCGQDHIASRLTLQRAGLLPCARIVRGRLAD